MGQTFNQSLPLPGAISRTLVARYPLMPRLNDPAIAVNPFSAGGVVMAAIGTYRPRPPHLGWANAAADPRSIGRTALHVLDGNFALL